MSPIWNNAKKNNELVIPQNYRIFYEKDVTSDNCLL